MNPTESKAKNTESVSLFFFPSRTPCVRENNRMETAHTEHEEAAHLPRTARVQRQPLSCASDTRWFMLIVYRGS